MKSKVSGDSDAHTLSSVTTSRSQSKIIVEVPREGSGRYTKESIGHINWKDLAVSKILSE